MAPGWSATVQPAVARVRGLPPLWRRTARGTLRPMHPPRHRDPRRTRRRLRAPSAVAVSVALLLGLVPAPASAAASLEVVPDSGVPGATLIASGTGFPSQVGIEIRWQTIGGAVLADGVADGAGAFKIAFVIPRTAAPGRYQVHACVVGTAPCPLSATATVRVLAPPAPSPSPSPSASPAPPTATPGAQPTTAPTTTPGPGVSPPPTGTPGPSATPGSLAGSPIPTGGPTLPVPAFPVDLTTPAPSTLDVVAVTPKPTPPSGITGSPGPFPDLDILAIEVTQGIQDLNNNMPLVAGRRTYARVHVDVHGAGSQPHTYGALEARRGGTQIGWIWPENGPIVARADGGNRVQLHDSLYFRLPQSWLAGTVTLTAFVYSLDIATPWTLEPTWENNFEQVTVTFHVAEPLEIHLVPLHLHRSFHGSDVVRVYEADPAGGAGVLAAPGASQETTRILAGLLRFHPISTLSVDVFGGIVGPLGHPGSGEWDLGHCAVPVVETPDGSWGTWIADWRPLMEDPDTPIPANASTTPDRDTVQILDRVYTLNSIFRGEDDRVRLMGTWTGSGPAPVPGAPAIVSGCPNPNATYGAPNSTVALWRIFYDWADAREFFIGMVHPSLPTRWGGLASKLDTAWVRMYPDVAEDSPWHHRGAALIAHEAGHLAGLLHVACKEEDGDGIPDELGGGPVDPAHPQQLRFPDCSLAEVREHGYFGFDVHHLSFGLPEPAVISNDPAVGAPAVAYPVLSYKGRKWIDPFHYCRLLVYYGVPCHPDTIDEPWLPPGGGGQPDFLWLPTGQGAPPANPGVPILLVTGSLDPGAATASLRGVLSLDAPTDAVLRLLERQGFLGEAEAGLLVTRDLAGSELRRIPIVVHAEEDHDGPYDFDLLVPLDPTATTVEVTDVDGGRLADLRVSPSRPEARWTGPATRPDGSPWDLRADTRIGFEMSDQDGDALTATLLYSPDGERWQVVATGIGDGDLVGPAVERLPGSDRGRLRILVSDGVHTTVAGGEPTVRVPDRPPRAWILSPGVPLRVPLGSRVELAGAASDPEGRIIGDAGLRWSSSRDGELGTGAGLTVEGLSAGHHVITLTATDPAGGVGVASMTIEVDPAVVEQAPSADLETAIGRLFERRATGDDPRPAATRAGDDTDLPIGAVLVLGFLGVVLAAAWARWRHIGGTAVVAGDVDGAPD